MPREAQPKPMGIQEKKSLEKIVNAEYEVLGREMDQYSAELIATRRREIEEQFADRQTLVDNAHREWEALRTRMMDEYRTFRERVREVGLEMAPSRYGRDLFITSPAEFSIPGKKVAMGNIEQDVKLQMNRAKTSLERKRVETNRQILVSGLAEEATLLLTRMPDPRELVVQALTESQNPRLALTLGVRPPAVPEAAQGEVVEGLVVHEDENMADRGA